MRSVILRRLPASVEQRQEEENGHTVFGESVAAYNFVDALLRHGSYDRYVFLCDAESDRRLAPQLERTSYADRVQLLQVDDVGRVPGNDEVILLTLDTLIGDLVFLRSFCARPDWPVCGLTHALSSARGLLNAMPLCFLGLQPHDAIVCTSRAGQGVMRNVLSRFTSHVEQTTGGIVDMPLRLPVIPLGVDTQAFSTVEKRYARWRLQLRADQTVFLNVGRMSTAFKMDPWPLLLAFSEVAQRRSDVLLILAGDDSVHHMAESLTRGAAELGCGERVRVMPNISRADKLGLYAAADVFVSISDNPQETFGITVIEAMAAGLPVIASDWNGYRDTVQHGETGLLVPTSWPDCTDGISHLALLREELTTGWLLGQSVCVSVDDLVAGMIALAGDPHTRAEMGRRGRARAVSHYDWQAVVRQHEALWSELLGAARRSPGQPALPIHTLIDHRALFDHYPTQSISDRHGVSLTGRGERFQRGELRLFALGDGPSPFDTGLLRQLLACCGPEPAPIDAVITSMERASDRRTDVYRHVALLAKYGFVHLTPPPPITGDDIEESLCKRQSVARRSS